MITWKHTYDSYEAVIGRCSATVRKIDSNVFGCSIDAKYAYAEDDSVIIDLDICKTKDSAMERCVFWANKINKKKHPNVEQVFGECYKNYKSLFRTRADVIDQLFFTIGNGYAWLDGSIINETPLAFEASEQRRKADKKRHDAEFQAIVTKASQLGDTRAYETFEEREAKLPLGPLPGGKTSFYPVCEYSKILHVPPDVHSDWLAVAYEAACMLRDSTTGAAASGRSVDTDTASNRRYGTEVVADLEERFPHLKNYNEAAS